MNSFNKFAQAGTEQEAKNSITLNVAQLDLPPTETILSEVEQLTCEYLPYDKYLSQKNAMSFSDSIADTQQSWCSLSWMQSYTDVIAQWLFVQNREQQLDIDEPIYILEAEAVTGQFGLTLLRMLHSKLKQLDIEHLPICYLFAQSSEPAQKQLAEHPLFEALFKEDKAKIIHWDIFHAAELPTKDINGELLNFISNPVFFIANGVLSSLPQHLVYLHYSDLYLGEVAELNEVSQEGENNQAEPVEAFIPFHLRQQEQKVNQQATSSSIYGKNINPKFAYRWQASTPENFVQSLDIPSKLQEFVTQVLHQELKCCHSEPLFLPIAALSALHKLRQSCFQGIVCLMSDWGITEELPLVQRFYLADKSSGESTKTKVNFPMLEQYQSKANGCNQLLQGTTQSKVSSVGFLPSLLDVAVQEDTKKIPDLLNAIVSGAFHGNNPQAQEFVLQNYRNNLESLTENQMMAALVQCNFDPKLLDVLLPRLLKEGVKVTHRKRWCELISNVWNRYIPVASHTSFTFRLGLLAVDLSHWPLAKQCFLTVMQLDGPSVACLHNLALAAFSTNEITIAQECITTASELEPEDKQVQQLQAEIDAYSQYCEQVNWYTPLDNELETSEQAASKPLIQLAPLGEQHLGEFYNQYRNPAIAKRLRGVEIDKFEHLQQLWLQWLEEGKRGEKAQYAVIHNQLGLVGNVTLDFKQHDGQESHDQAPILSFWIGTDYQGNGFGNEAVRQVILQAQQMASKGLIDDLQTSAWSHNFASRKILENNGFEFVTERHKATINAEDFYLLELV